jgi:hypothetical protein
VWQADTKRRLILSVRSFLHLKWIRVAKRVTTENFDTILGHAGAQHNFAPSAESFNALHKMFKQFLRYFLCT